MLASIGKAAGAVAIVAAMFATTMFAQMRIDRMRREAIGDDLLYIPSKAILKHLTAGMSNVVADLLWIETIQYTVSEFHNPERKFKWLDHMLTATTDLDPYFEGAYVNGGTFLSAIGRDDRALEFLKEGFVRNPRSWRLPHEIVKVYVLNRRDQPEAAAVAPYYLRMVAERHEHPELYLNWARQIQERDDLAAPSRSIWEDVIRTTKDPFVREVAEKNLSVLIAGDIATSLQTMADHYRSEHGVPPASPEVFVELGWLVALPDENVYGRFIIDGEGNARSFLVGEDRRQRMLMHLNAALRIEMEERGRSPKDLAEFESWYGRELPAHPIPGKVWKYDVTTQTIS